MTKARAKTTNIQEVLKGIPLIDLLKKLTSEEVDALANKVPTSTGNLWQIAYGHGACSPKMAREIALATEWKVTPHLIAPKHYPYPLDGLPPEHRPAVA